MIKKIIVLIGLVFLIIILLYIKEELNIKPYEVKFITYNNYLKLKTVKENKIYYTLDGTIPTINSNLYKEKIKLDKNTSPNTLTDSQEQIYGQEITSDETLPKGVIVRAIAISPDGKAGDVYTKTIFPNMEINDYYSNEMVISLVTDPNNLIDYENGIMVKGKIYDEWLKNNNKKISKKEELVESKIVNGNFMQHGRDWEKEGNIEIFEDNIEQINEQIGYRIKGNISRMYNQKSLNLYFRNDYNKEYLDYDLFSIKDVNNKKITKYKSFSLRNGGNDTDLLKFKDAWLQQLVKNRSIDIQSSKPIVLFINGEYWGVYNLQEKYSKDYYSSHYNLNRENIIVIKEHELEEGLEEDYILYEKLMSYANKDLSNEKIYQEFLELVDLESMLDYYAIQTYINNADWGIEESNYQKNILLWRTREKENNKYGDTKWRWSLFDLEFSSSLYNLPKTSASYCSIDNAIKKHPLFASAMKNEEFKKQFYNTYYELKKENFNIKKIETTLMTEFDKWEPLMKEHYKRFGNHNVQRIASRNSIINYFKDKYYSNPC